MITLSLLSEIKKADNPYINVEVISLESNFGIAVGKLHSRFL
jgi:hypothetical protein